MNISSSGLYVYISISANLGGGGIPRDTSVTKIPVQIKQDTDPDSVSRPALTSYQEIDARMGKREEYEGSNDHLDSGQEHRLSSSSSSSQEYRSVSVSTHWSWDDIFHTVSTTDEEGTQH